MNPILKFSSHLGYIFISNMLYLLGLLLILDVLNPTLTTLNQILICGSVVIFQIGLLCKSRKVCTPIIDEIGTGLYDYIFKKYERNSR